MISPKVYIYGALLLASVAVVGGGGFKIGSWYQASADSTEVKNAQDALTANANAVAAAEKAGREAAAEIYRAEIKGLKDRATRDAELAESLRNDKESIQSKYSKAQKTIQEMNREPSVQSFRNTPLPPALIDGLLKSLGDSPNASSGGGYRANGIREGSRVLSSPGSEADAAGGGSGERRKSPGRVATRSGGARELRRAGLRAVALGFYGRRECARAA